MFTFNNLDHQMFRNGLIEFQQHTTFDFEAGNRTKTTVRENRTFHLPLSRQYTMTTCVRNIHLSICISLCLLKYVYLSIYHPSICSYIYSSVYQWWSTRGRSRSRDRSRVRTRTRTLTRTSMTRTRTRTRLLGTRGLGRDRVRDHTKIRTSSLACISKYFLLKWGGS